LATGRRKRLTPAVCAGGVRHPLLGCLLTEVGSSTFGNFRGFVMTVVAVRAFVNERLSHLRLRARRG
jgi:hypothetical protein